MSSWDSSGVLQHALTRHSGSGRPVFDKTTVQQPNDPIGVLGDLLIVRNYENSGPLLVETPQ
jgi:hypothetical protein